jgi:hypothetical protein
VIDERPGKDVSLIRGGNVISEAKLIRDAPIAEVVT